MLEFVSDVDHHVRGFRKSESVDPAAGKRADPHGMALRKAGEYLSCLGHGHAQHLRQLDRFARRLGFINFITDNHQRSLRLNEKFGRPFDFLGIRSYPHARIDFILRDNLGADLCLVKIGMP